jgi:tetratricopeptide (TPR) repeat protein
MELRLSLAEVAQKDFSRAFLNQVELGRARPSTRTLQIIATRLKRPIEYFLQDPDGSVTALELRLAEAGTMLGRGQAAPAEELLRDFITRPQMAPEMRIRAQLLLAQALLKLHRIAEAIDLIKTAIKAAEAGGRQALSVELYDRMGSAYYQLRQPHEAGRWWDRAINAYEDTGLSDPLLKARILGHRANLHYVAGQPREAIAGYQAAIAAAEDVLDMQALAGIYEGLAVSFKNTGDLTRALDYAQRSLRLFETLQDIRMSAQLRNNMAEILLSQGRNDEAEALFLAGAQQLRRIGDRDLLPHLLSGAAEAALNRGDQALAASRIEVALTATNGSGDRLAELVANRVAGRVAAAAGQAGEARAHFERALTLADELESPADLSRVAFDYAQVLEEIGDASQALIRYRQAYRARQVARP